MKEMVLRIRYGGLGDHLIWSPIPKLAKKAGYERVYISNLSEYRNPETKELVWERNPHIDGFVDKDAPTPNFRSVEAGKNILDAHVDFVGLPDDGVRFREPELYYIPNFLEDYMGLTVYDPNYISNAGHPTGEQVAAYFKKHKIEINLQLEPTANNSAIPGICSLNLKGLLRYADVIHSCKKFYCLTSGSATLAAALRKPAIVLYESTNPMFHHSKLHTYIKLG
jgi:hypothetical protein